MIAAVWGADGDRIIEVKRIGELNLIKVSSQKTSGQWDVPTEFVFRKDSEYSLVLNENNVELHEKKLSLQQAKGVSMNQTALKIVGVSAIVVGAIALYLSGTGADTVAAITGAVFVVAGLIAGIFAVKEKK